MVDILYFPDVVLREVEHDEVLREVFQNLDVVRLEIEAFQSSQVLEVLDFADAVAVQVEAGQICVEVEVLDGGVALCLL